MKQLFILFLFISVQIFAQTPLKTSPQVAKDPYFNQKSGNTQNPQQVTPENKVKVTHYDILQKTPDKYDGNPFFKGNVVIEHQGSVLTADEVILYEEQSFVKAIGNAKLQNADGSVITANEMEYDGKSEKGIARKNVVLTDPKQTIKTETLYYERPINQAYFNTGGTIYANNSVTYAKVGTYNVATKIIDISGNVKINNDQYTLEGSNIKQYQNTNTAEIFGFTTIRNKQNPSNYLTTERGTYKMSTKEAFLTKNSTIYYNGKILTGDEMYFNQITGFGKATGNVLLRDPKEKRFIKGGYGEIYEKTDSAMVTNKPLAVKILEKDSVYFGAERFITTQKPDVLDPQVKRSFLRAYKKVRLFKTNIQARGDSLSFNETDGILHLFYKPMAWTGEKQVSGDKIEGYFDVTGEKLDSLKVIGNAFAISKVDSLNMKDEFNQVKGKLMTVYYEENEVKNAKVIGNAQAITYADDVNEKTKESERIGITLSTCGIIDALFEEKIMQIITCDIGANMDTYPMSKIDPAQRKFPDFNWNTKDRPRKWQDVYLDTPDYEEIKYEGNSEAFDAAKAEIDKQKAAEEAKKPKRTRR